MGWKFMLARRLWTGRRRPARRPARLRGEIVSGLLGALVAGAQLAGPRPATAATVADSRADWSTRGVQGEAGWFSGYSNRSADADGVYSTDDFIAFSNLAGPEGGPVSPEGNHWNGTSWDLLAEASGPWTSLGREATHPNAASTPGGEHWTIRRWRCDRAAPLALRWHLRKTNPRGGGVTCRLFINGLEVQTDSIAGEDDVGIQRIYYARLAPGDLIDLALDPTGPLGDPSDGSDGSANWLRIEDVVPPEAVNRFQAASSVLDWSALGVQGAGGWLYGYYDHRLDAHEGNGSYDAADFLPFLRDGTNVPGPSNHWDGSKWNMEADEAETFGPWTQLTRDGGHPAANFGLGPEVHWAVRRWVSDVGGLSRLSGRIHNVSDAGDGTVSRIFLNGEEILSVRSDGEAHEYSLELDLEEGDMLDFAIDSDGAGIYRQDVPALVGFIDGGSDSTVFTARLDVTAPFDEDESVAFRRGDVDSSARVELTDAVALLESLFLGAPPPPCADAADVDDSGDLNLSDAVRLLNHLFLGAPPPPAPGPEECGEDPSEDGLDCERPEC